MGRQNEGVEASSFFTTAAKETEWDGRVGEGGRVKGAPTPRRELRGSGARGYIIKKQETSSFSPALVKILNGDFMLPVLVACAA